MTEQIKTLDLCPSQHKVPSAAAGRSWGVADLAHPHLRILCQPFLRCLAPGLKGSQRRGWEGERGMRESRNAAPTVGAGNVSAPVPLGEGQD